MIITTKKHKINPFIVGLKCELLKVGYFEEIHNSYDGNGETILKYDLKIKLPSGMVTFANSEWLENFKMI